MIIPESGGGITYSKLGFTLAEMMVVMLILTIVLAAFAPLMTKRKNIDLSSSPWRYTENNNGDIYYGLGASQTAMIGQNEKASNDPQSRLLIKTNSDNESYITLKSGNGLLATLLMYLEPNSVYSGDLRFGGPFKTTVTSGDGNTSFGLKALQNITSSSIANTAFGENALQLNTSDNNSGFGSGTLRNNIQGELNTAVGAGSILENVSGNNNTALGAGSLYTNVSGSKNTALGAYACRNVKGSNKTCIGAESGPAVNTKGALESDNIERIYIGGKSNFNGEDGIIVVQNPTESQQSAHYGISEHSATSVTINGALVVNGPIINKVRGAAGSDDTTKYMVLHNTEAAFNTTGSYTYYNLARWMSATDPGVNNQDWANAFNDFANFITSDKRLKNIKSENKSGLEELRNLKVYDYTFKKDKEKTPQVGVMAQDLQKVFPNAVKKDNEGFLMIRRDEIFYAMLNSIKQLDTLVQGLINEVKVVLNKITTHDNEIKALQKENNELRNKNAELEKRLQRLEERFAI